MAGRTLILNGGNRMEQYIQTIKQRLGNGAVVNVGFLEGATYPAGKKVQVRRKGKVVGRKIKPGPATGPPLGVAQVAFWNEFGTKRAPPRPFFRRMIAKESKDWGKKMGRMAKRLDYDTPKILNQMGRGVQDQLRKSIRDLTDPKLSDVTIAIKGFDKPLIDTSTMIRAVDYEVKGE